MSHLIILSLHIRVFLFLTRHLLFCKYLYEGHWFFSDYCCVLPSINKDDDDDDDDDDED